MCVTVLSVRGYLVVILHCEHLIAVVRAIFIPLRIYSVYSMDFFVVVVLFFYLRHCQ